jgi:CARDB
MPRLRRFVPILLAILAACGDGDPSGPSGGTLAVSVSGLPAGTDAAITVTGPGGYRHDLSASETLTGLAPGGYTVAATPVSSGGQSYRPVVPSQTVTVSGGSAAASVVYGAAGGTLTINVAGLPPGESAAIHVSGPSGYSADVTASTTLGALDPGPYTVTAQSVAPGGTTYNPSPGSQIANITTGASKSANVSYTAGASGGFNLRIDGMYLTQSVQTYTDAVPLVKNRDGYLRVFVTANVSNLAAPSVRVQFYVAGVLESTVTIPPPGISAPLSPSEGNLASSWNVAVPKTLIQPGLSILADVDPNNAVAEADETDNQFPASGTALPMNVRTTSAFSVSLVPVVQSVNGRQGDVSGANLDSYLTAAMKIHPLATYDAVVRSPFTTSAPEVQDDNANGAWITILSQLDAARTADPSGRYYYGVINPPYTSGVAGVGYIGGETALGWDKSGADWVAAHEWGHNWGRKHAPTPSSCGQPSNVDTQYPYADGSTGIYGLDVATLSLKPPTAHDVMGYCSDDWVSDYTYQGILAWREAQPDVASALALAMQPCLLVWGRIEDGRAVLEPAFQVVTRPNLPPRPGPYSVEGTDASGGRLFQVSFTAQEVADDPHGGRYFAFAVPLQPDRAGRLATLRLSAPGRPVVSVRAASTAGAALDLQPARPARGRVALSWNASTHPMVMVRDPASGQVLSFAAGGVAEIATDRSDLEVQLSNGLAGRSVRVVVPR